MDTGVLWLNKAVPRSWFADGERIAVKDAPTHYGPISYDVRSRARHGGITARIDGSRLEGVKTIVLRFRHPEKKKLKQVRLNGELVHTFDAERETIRLTPTRRKMTVTASY